MCWPRCDNSSFLPQPNAPGQGRPRRRARAPPAARPTARSWCQSFCPGTGRAARTPTSGCRALSPAHTRHTAAAIIVVSFLGRNRHPLMVRLTANAPLQSFISTRPKMWSVAFASVIGAPSGLPGPTRNACQSAVCPLACGCRRYRRRPRSASQLLSSTYHLELNVELLGRAKGGRRLVVGLGLAARPADGRARHDHRGGAAVVAHGQVQPRDRSSIGHRLGGGFHCVQNRAAVGVHRHGRRTSLA